MKDEIERNLSKLSYKDYPKPFYISYTIQDIKTLSVTASFGAIIKSKENKYRSWSNRVLCGNYKLNDENYYDATSTKASNDGYLELPIDDDYDGLRRSLWLITNNTYKSAAQTYLSKISALKEKKLSEDSLQIPDFAEAPQIELIIPYRNISWDKSKTEALVRKLSSIFYKYPEISYSYVSIYQLNAKMYFYSSEKTKIFQPLNYLYLTITAQTKSKDGENISNQLQYFVNEFEQLPDESLINADINKMIENIMSKANSVRLSENYNGPVLFEDQAAAEVFLQTLFSDEDNLCASREILYNVSQMSLFYGPNSNTLDTKIGRQVIDKNISIIDISKTKTYKGIPLVGSYEVDAEGVIPPDTLYLIKDGILHTLYNGRTPTRNIPYSNGHYRYVLDDNIVTSSIGPGCIIVNSAKNSSNRDLIDKLIDYAKEEGHQYAYIVRPFIKGNYFASFNVYQIDVDTRKEKLVRGISLKPLKFNSLKKIEIANTENTVYNALINEDLLKIDPYDSFQRSSLMGGKPVSIICPSSVLVKDVDIQYLSRPLSDDKYIVPSPNTNAQ